LIIVLVYVAAVALILLPFSVSPRIRRQEATRTARATGTADALDAAVTKLEAAFPSDTLTRR
jgi:hypothetical protein